jgi:hypothetical protein
MAIQSLTETNALEAAMFQAIKKQSVSKNYQWKKKEHELHVIGKLYK